MKLARLKEELNEYDDDDLDVVILIQASRYPIECKLYRVELEKSSNTQKDTLYLVQGDDIGYGPRGLA